MPRQAEEVLQYEDFLGWTVSSLKDFLSLRGLEQTGRKPELVARAFGAYELKAPVKFSQQQIYQQIKFYNCDRPPINRRRIINMAWVEKRDWGE